jgi:hypothetical protein
MIFEKEALSLICINIYIKLIFILDFNFFEHCFRNVTHSSKIKTKSNYFTQNNFIIQNYSILRFIS